MFLAQFFHGHVQLDLGQKPKLRVDNAKCDLVLVLTLPLVLYLKLWKTMGMKTVDNLKEKLKRKKDVDCSKMKEKIKKEKNDNK